MSNKFQTNYIINDECLACGNDDLRTILDLSDQPLANNYHNGQKQETYPLKLNLCSNCQHLQLSHTINPDIMFKNYLYVSGTSQTLKDYFDYFAKKTLEEYYPGAKNVLDIACNDATQLDSYQKLGIQTFGIDPAENLFNAAVSKGHNIICDYFNTDTINQFKDKKFDIITAQNVFAHNYYTVDFLKACKQIMHDGSVLFIQTSQANMVINNEFDTIYHEHLSFFNTKSMKMLVERCGLVLSDVFKTDIHGTSYVFVITKTKNFLEKTGTQEMLDFEEKKGLYNILTYPDYASKCYKTTFKLKDVLNEYKNKGYILIGYGAAAKGNTLLNFGKINLDYIIDDNPLKQNLLTPGMDIPIYSSEKLLELTNTDKVIFIPLAWNFFKEIKTRIEIKRKNQNDLFIKYFPELQII